MRRPAQVRIVTNDEAVVPKSVLRNLLLAADRCPAHKLPVDQHITLDASIQATRVVLGLDDLGVSA